MLPQRNVNRHLILLWKISYDSTPYKSDARPVDSAGLKLCGAGKWLVEKHGAKTRRSWRKRHLGVDADTRQIAAAALTAKEVDDGAEVGPLLDQVTGAVASFTADGAYGQEGVTAAVAERHPEAAIIVPPRSTAVPSEAAETAPTQRDRHLHSVEPRGSPDIAEHGRAAWQISLRPHEASPRRSDRRQVQAGDRRRPALAHGPASRDRGGRCRPCAQPHA